MTPASNRGVKVTPRGETARWDALPRLKENDPKGVFQNPDLVGKTHGLRRAFPVAAPPLWVGAERLR